VMKQFEFLEHYVEFMGGFRDIHGQSKYAGEFRSPLRLANYDVNILADITKQLALHNLSLSQKQRDLCFHLATKYSKQLRKFNIEPPRSDIPCERGIRKVDSVRSLSITDDHLSLRFPFNGPLIKEIRSYSEYSKGRVFWNKPNGYWQLAATEQNIIWVTIFAQKHGISITDDVLNLYKRINTAMPEEAAIELVRTETGFIIRGANESLINYINDNLGGFGPENYYRLVDNASYLGYDLSKEIFDSLSKIYSMTLVKCLTLRSAEVPVDLYSDVYRDLVSWMRLCNEKPIIIYDPTSISDKYDIDLNIPDVVKVTREDFVARDRALFDNAWTLISCYGMVSYQSKNAKMLQTARRIIYIGNNFGS
jgi:hypothetical protein